MTNAQCEKISIFLEYIHHNNISVIFEEFDKDKQIASVLGFTKILKEIAGDEFSCTLDKSNFRILIYDDVAKEFAGHIYGTVEHGYIRGDFHESELHIIYAVIENNVYIGGQKIAYIDSLQQIMYEHDNIYVIDKITKSLLKYSNHEKQWDTPIPVNSTQCVYFCPTMNYLGDPYPNNLVALRDLFDLYHFSKENGEFYGHTRIETTYKLL